MALLDKYSFEVDGTPVTPTNDRLQMEWQRKDGTRFFRKSLKTALRFTGADFLFFETEFAANDCKTFELTIYRKCLTQIPQLWHTGRIYLNDGKYDHARGTVEYEVESVDLYTCFLKGIKNKVNLLAYGTPLKTLNASGTIVTQTCTETSLNYNFVDCISGGASSGLWTAIRHHVSADVGFEVAETTWAREEWGPTTPPDQSWTLVGGIWVREVIIMSSVILNDNLPYYTYEAFLYDFDTQGGIDNGRLLRDILEDVVNASGCGFNLVTSDFFDVNPLNLHPTNLAYTRADERLKHLMIYQRTDVVKWDAANNAIRADITIEDFLKVLFGLFQVYWVIRETEDGLTFQIEHVSYFSAINQTDFTAGAYANYSRGYQRYTVSGKDVVPPYEVFSNPGSRQPSVFGDTRITYPAECVTSDQQRENTVMQASTDLTGTIYNDLLNPEGLFVMATYLQDDKYFVFQDYFQLNGCLSWWELVNYYWMHDRFSGTATITGHENSEDVTFLSRKRIKEQPEVKIPVSCDVETDFNPDALQRLPLGWSEVQSATYDTKTEVLALKTSI